jgi:hypothetical protein
MDLKVKQNWQHFYDLYLKSGLTKVDFCRSQKLTQSRFFYFAKLHRDPSPSKQSSSSNLFLPLVSKKDFTIKINNKVELSFESIPDARWMANFVKSLGDAHACA